MADNYLNYTGLDYYHNRIRTLFATKGEVQDVADAVAAITIPENVSAFTNDADYQTGQEVDDAITAALAGITGVSFEVVDALPASGEAGVIYLVANSGAGSNAYDEYIYVNGAFEKIGTTDVDLSQYWAKSELVAITTAEIDTITAE